MTKPLDIDGNELRVGNCVEFVKDSFRRGGIDIRIGDRFIIKEFYGPAYIAALGGDFFHAIIDDIMIATVLLRLIEDDQKAPTRIEFVVKELTK